MFGDHYRMLKRNQQYLPFIDISNSAELTS